MPTDNGTQHKDPVPPSEDLMPTGNGMQHKDPVPKETESVAEDDRRPISASPDGFQEHVVNADIHGDEVNAAVTSELPSVDHSETDDVIGNSKQEKMEISSHAVKPKILQSTFATECGMKKCSLETGNDMLNEDTVTEPPLEENLLSAGTSEVLASSYNVILKGGKDLGNLKNDSPGIPRGDCGWKPVFKKPKENAIVKRGYNMRRNVRESKVKILSAEKRKCLDISDKTSRDPAKSSKLQDDFHVSPMQGVSKCKE